MNNVDWKSAYNQLFALMSSTMTEEVPVEHLGYAGVNNDAYLNAIQAISYSILAPAEEALEQHGSMCGVYDLNKLSVERDPDAVNFEEAAAFITQDIEEILGVEYEHDLSGVDITTILHATVVISPKQQES